MPTSDKLTLQQLLDLIYSLLSNCQDAEDVEMDRIRERPTTEREKRMSRLINNLYILIHPYCTSCAHPGWVEFGVEKWKQMQEAKKVL